MSTVLTMHKRDQGKEERDRLRSLPGDEGAVWRGVYCRNEDEWVEALMWEDAQTQAQRPIIFVTKYSGARSKSKRQAAAGTAAKATPGDVTEPS